MSDFPDHLKVRVDYYDAEEKELLLKAPYPAEAIKSVAGRVIEIKTPDFFRAFLTHRILTRPDIYKSFSKITNLEKAWDDLEETAYLESGTVRWHPEALKQTQTEHVGEALGISVINQIHPELSDGDWTPIGLYNRKKGKAMDFRASEGDRLVYLETKGLAPRRPLSSGSFGKQKRDEIKAQKEAVRSAKLDAYQENRDVLYGTIAGYTKDVNSIARVQLLDPEPPYSPEEPAHLRVLARLSYIAKLLAIISPGSPLSHSLANRVLDLEAVTDWRSLMGRQLVRPNGEKYILNDTFWRNRSHLIDQGVPGSVVGVGARGAFFLGVDFDFLRIAIAQRLDSISEMNLSGSVRKVHASIFLGEDDARLIGATGESSGGRIRTDASGTIYQTTGGMYFGWLQPF